MIAAPPIIRHPTDWTVSLGEPVRNAMLATYRLEAAALACDPAALSAAAAGVIGAREAYRELREGRNG